jgi:hypothetical protein
MKRFFLTRSTREKGLLVAFVALGAGAWMISGLGRARAVAAEWRSVTIARQEQQEWLRNQPEIEARSAQATAQLDASRTLNGTRLIGELNSLARAAGLAPEVSGQRTERTTQFAFHSAQVNFRRVEIAALVRFYEDVAKRSPYVGLEQVSITVDRGAPGTLNATFRVVAAELQR